MAFTIDEALFKSKRNWTANLKFIKLVYADNTPTWSGVVTPHLSLLNNISNSISEDPEWFPNKVQWNAWAKAQDVNQDAFLYELLTGYDIEAGLEM